MRYTITSQQVDHLRKEGALHFEGVYPREKIDLLRTLLSSAESETGRDLQRGSPPLLKTLNPSMLGQIAAELYHKSRVKIAFTQLLPAYQTAASVDEISSVTEVFGAMLIHLDSGDATFFLPSSPIDFPHLEEAGLLVAFATDRARYRIRPQDPHTHSLKNLGYASGDRLTEDTHPLIHH